MKSRRDLQLQPGASIAGYRVEARIGAGGMGEVYRAYDPQLDRKVAIKLLSVDVDDSADARSRLLREARAAAALNHANLCTIYEVAETEGHPFIVMELLDGETLDALIPSGGMSAEVVMRHTAALADALAHAHDRGIIHRDLKPANIRITSRGVLKVLDFGLAKAQADLGNNADTRALNDLTTPGTVLGTAAYMSPEQAQGKPVDKRTDIWAFGAVVYQMLTGRAAFKGDSFASTVAAVLMSEPEWNRVPTPFRRLLEACLEKDVNLRLRDVGDARALLDMPSPASTPRARRSRFALAAGLAIGLAVASAGWIIARPAAPAGAPVVRWSTTLVETGGGERGLAISPDGRLLAYTGRAQPIRPIWIRSLQESEARAIPGTDGGRRPFFSPDGKWLAYFSGVGRSSLMKVSVSGGMPTKLCENAGYLGGSWGDDDQIVVTGQEGLLRVSASGGSCEALTTAGPANGRAGHRSPQVLPGGKTVIFGVAEAGNLGDAQIALIDIASRQVRVLEQRGTMARYLSSGHLVYVRGSAMFAVPFDLARLEATGPEVLAIDGILWNAQGGFSDYTVSEHGTLLYTSSESAHRTLAWLDLKDGTVRPSLAPLREYAAVSVSPDGRLVATAFTTGGEGIYVVDLERGSINQISPRGQLPIWTPDGRRVVYGELRGELYSVRADGSGAPENLVRGVFATAESVTPDGLTLFYTVSPSRDPQARDSIGMLSLAGGSATASREPWPVTTTRSERGARISPDGRWIAYVSDESGKNQIYLRAYPGPAGKMAISIDGGQEPRWSRNPQALYFRNPETNQLMTAGLQVPAGANPGRPRVVGAQNTPIWDIAPDGGRVLFVKDPDAGSDTGTVQVVMNWFDELRRNVRRN